MNSERLKPFLPIVGVIGLLAVWSLTTFQQWVDPVLLPSPIATFKALWKGMDGGALGFDFVKTVYRTAAAMFPLFLVLFGVGDETKISVAALGAILVILFNVAYGVMNARKTRLLAAKVMGASRLRVLFDVMLLESLPQTFVGLRNSVSLALVIIVVAEMFIGSQDGLGHSVFEAQQLFDMPRMYAAIFAAGALGYGLNLLFILVERRFVHWAGK